MAYDALKAEIRQYITTNGANEITGQILQNVLLDMVNAYPSLDGYATQQWVQNQNYLTSAELSGYATETWVQNQLGLYLPLTGGTLTGDLNIAYSSKLNFGTSYIYQSTIPGPQGSQGHILNFYGVDGYGYYDFDNSVHATSFVKANGTSAQFLKADGSVDENTYLIPGSRISLLGNDVGYLTSADLSGYAKTSDLGNYLPLTGGTLTGDLNMANCKLNFGTAYIQQYQIPGPQGSQGHILEFEGVDGYGYYNFDNSVHATSFVKSGGTSAQFLKADGSVDNTSYLPLTGGTLTGALTMNGSVITFYNSSSNNSWGSIYHDSGDGLVLSASQTSGGQTSSHQIFLNASNVYVNEDMEVDHDLQVNDDFRCSGNAFVGVSTSVDNCYLNIRNNAQIYSSNSNPYLLFHVSNTDWSRIEMDTNGDFHFQSAPTGTSYKALYASAFNQPSDIRKKNILGDVVLDLNSIANAPLFKFKWKDEKDENVHIGTSAQYWQGLMPELVSENRNGVLGMQYDVAAMAGVTTVAKVVVDHEDRISAIERKLNIN